MTRKVLICGVSGQDGAYLSKLLIGKGYSVFGGSRDANANAFTNLRKLNILNNINLVSINLNDFRSVIQTITQIQPDEIYNLAGQTSVGLSFEQPVETIESIAIGTLNLLEAIRFSRLPIKFYNAGSGECFGDTSNLPADENTPFKPRSPYAVAKSTATSLVVNYREAYNLFACTGILFNHESPLRPQRFVTSKIISTACRIARGSDEKLILGNVAVARDWGWAPEYVEAMWLMLQQDQPDDFVIATGKTSTLIEFIELSFVELGLDYRNYLEINTNFYRPTDLTNGFANPQKAEKKLNWKSKFGLSDIVKEMIKYEFNNNQIL